MKLSLIKIYCMQNRFTLLILLALFTFGLQGQGLHFTQFEFAPLTVNPALAGAYKGSFRLGGIFRDQYGSVATNSFTTLNFMVDAPIIRGFRSQDWIGVGIGTTALDEAGALGYKTTFFRINGAYHLSLDKKQTRIFTVGIQMNNASVKLNTLTSDDTRGGTLVSDPDVENFNNRAMNGEVSDGYGDYVLGLMFNSRGVDSDLKIGISAARVLGPELRIGPSLEELDMRFVLFGNLTRQLNKKTSFSPGVLVQLQGPAREIVAQGKLGYLINESKGLKLNGGLGYRIGDALQFLVGADIKNIKVGVGYDMNISGLTPATGTVGGFEIGVSYMGNIFKKPKVKPIVVCPSL
jgi:type IX secretion system PorP/SprF family membrane protein